MVPISIRTQNAYHQYQEGINLIIGVYFGFILVNISLAFFSVIMLRRSIYLWYGFFLISMLGYSISTFGYGFQYLIPDYPGYNDILRSYLALLSSFLSFALLNIFSIHEVTCLFFMGSLMYRQGL